MISLINMPELIGDTLGIFPSLQKIIEKNGEIEVLLPMDSFWIFNLMPNEYYSKIRLVLSEDKLTGSIVKFKIGEAFDLAARERLFMTDAMLKSFGFPLFEKPAKAKLRIEPESTPIYDFIISPFSRCLPDNQRWPKENWQKLVDSFPNKQFCLIGTKRYDDIDYITGNNVNYAFDRSLNYVSNILLKAKGGLISVMTGTTILAYMIGCKNIVITTQNYNWGRNPDGVFCYSEKIENISVNEVISEMSNL